LEKNQKNLDLWKNPSLSYMACSNSGKDIKDITSRAYTEMNAKKKVIKKKHTITKTSTGEVIPLSIKDTAVKKGLNSLATKNGLEAVKVPQSKVILDNVVEDLLNEIIDEDFTKSITGDHMKSLMTEKIDDFYKGKSHKYKYNDILDMNSVDNLVMTKTSVFLKNHIKLSETSKIPLYTHITHKDCPNYNVGERWTNWSIPRVIAQDKYVMDSKLDDKLHYFSIDMGRSPFFVIDTDSKEGDDLVKEHFGNLPYTTSVRGKGKHYWARKDKLDIGKYVRQNKLGGKDIDIIYNGVLFERRHNKEGEHIPVKNWDGDHKKIPIIPISLIEDKLGFKMPTMTKNLALSKDQIKKHNAEIARLFASKKQIWGSPKMKLNIKLANEVLFALATDKFVADYNHTRWKELALSWYYQIPNASKQDQYYKSFQAFTIKCWDLYKGQDSKQKWLDENTKLWKWCETNAYTSTTDSHKKTLWKMLYEYNPRQFKLLSRKDKGKVEDCVYNSIREYDKIKELFELTNYELVGSTSASFIEENKKLEITAQRNMTQLVKERYRNITYDYMDLDPKTGEEIKKTGLFIKKWLADDYRLQYDIQDFLPTGIEELNDTDIINRLDNDAVKNDFEGLKAEELRMNEDIQKKVEEMKVEGEELYGDKYYHIRKLLQHIYYLSGGDCVKQYDYLLKWIAHRVRYCGIQPRVALVFKSIEGVGKDMFFGFLGNDIMGAEYYTNTDDYDKVLGRFNTSIAKCLLLALNESSMGDTTKYENAMKTLITDKKRQGEAKYKDSVEMRMCLGLVLFTNKEFVMSVGETQRRYAFYMCEDKHMTKPEYFTELAEVMENEYCKGLFVDYLYNEVEVEPLYDFKRNRVRNEYTNNLMRRSEPIMLKFTRWLVRNWGEGKSSIDLFQTRFTSDWYELYLKCCVEQGYKTTKNKENFTEEFINYFKLKKNEDPDEPCNNYKFLDPKRGNASTKYKINGKRLADYLYNKDKQADYYAEGEQPDYNSICKEEYDAFLGDSDNEEVQEEDYF